jgi:hypothetical protein
MYLKGDADRGFSLIVVEPSGKEKAIDRVKSTTLAISNQ